MKLSVLPALLVLAGLNAHAEITNLSCDTVTATTETSALTSFESKMPGYPGLWLTSTLKDIRGQNFEVAQDKVEYNAQGYATKIVAYGQMGDTLVIEIPNPSPAQRVQSVLSLDGQYIDSTGLRCIATQGDH